LEVEMVRALRHLSVLVGVASLAFAVASPAASAEPAHCNKKTDVCTPPSKLKWVSPKSVADGVPATFRSIGRCPDTRADGSPLQGVREVAITVLFHDGGGIGDVGPVNADGSWTFVHTFEAGGTRDLHAMALASCLDVTFTGIDIADYRPHPIAVNP
jgi:hypothetical protein